MEYLNYIIPLLFFVLGIILKTLLDFNLAHWVVKRLHWVPTRWLFRQKPLNISGEWSQFWWTRISKKYKDKDGRRTDVNIKQFGKYIYGELRVNDNEDYYVFGEVDEKYVYGKWGDKNDPSGLFGVFEYRIINSKLMKGYWMGHSNTTPDKIHRGKWIWKRK